MGGGPIGLAAIQLLKILGFGPIALAEPVEEKRRLGKALGAQWAINPLQEDLHKLALEWTHGVGFEGILECSGVPGNISLAFDLAAKGGAVCMVSVIFRPITLNGPMMMNFKEIHFTASMSNTHEENYQCLEWLRQKRLDAKSLISDYTSLEDLPRLYRDRIHPGKVTKVMIQIGEEF